MLVAAHLTLRHGSLGALEGDVCVEAMTMEEPPAPRASELRRVGPSFHTELRRTNVV